jgi:DNA-repair protein complementing XP-A cells
MKLAKARQREKEQAASEASSSSSSQNANNKRPLTVIPADGEYSPTVNSNSNSDRSKPLKRDARLGTYFEYDLSKMINSKGGFLVEERNRVDEDELRKLRERERERLMQNVDPRACAFCHSIYEL